MIHVAVVLPQDGYQRVVFLHHIAARPEGLALTESVELWPMWRDDENWTRGNIIGGRVLCGRRGQTYTADFAALAGQFLCRPIGKDAVGLVDIERY